jgi:tRNA 2-thiocytidine biosynthesis protein TtcA
MFYQAQLKAMPPKLRSDDGRHVVIRPLAYCKESDIADYAEQQAVSDHSRATSVARRKICSARRCSACWHEWERCSPAAARTIFRALAHVSPSHLADRQLFDFSALGRAIRAMAP